jgi:hypothetical protein
MFMLPQVAAMIWLPTTTMNSLCTPAVIRMTMILSQEMDWISLRLKSIQKMKQWVSTSLRHLVSGEHFQPFDQMEPRQNFVFGLVYWNQSLRDRYGRNAAGHFLSGWSADLIKLRLSDGKPGPEEEPSTGEEPNKSD